MSTTTTTIDRVGLAAWLAGLAKNAETARLQAAAYVNAQTVQHEPKWRARNAMSPSVSAPASVAAVMACIRAHESGDYTEHSHPSGSSGAYQYQPGTWRTWSARAGYPGYLYAYLAPPGVQDAVTAYTLTHGGAGNWSTRWGNDPCTRGLPGGG